MSIHAIALRDKIVKEGNYYANSTKFVLPSSLFMGLVYAGIKSKMSFAIKNGA